MDDLFSRDFGAEGHSSEGGLYPRLPLAARMRPHSLDEIVGQQHLLGSGSPLRVLAEGLADSRSAGVGPASVILYGPPGTGKTTFAHVIAQRENSGISHRFVELSATSAGVKNVRQVMEEALLERDLHGRITVLFLDEIHRFNKAQQDALLPAVENRWIVLVAATTENPVFSVINALLSRSLVLSLRPLDDANIAELIERAIEDPRGLNGELTMEAAAKEHIIRLAAGDARRSLTALEAAAAAAVGQGLYTISLEHVENALDKAMVRYDRQGDQHYDVASAFIKSMRGSDVDAAMHYLARMLEAGEDPRFIARRVMILASEDIGLADSNALAVAVNAAQAVAMVGMPEARIILAQAVAYMATAPKSNAVYTAVDAAIADIRAGKGKGVPNHLRDQHYVGSEKDRKAQEYKYSHHENNAVATQQYPPDDLVGIDYYSPTDYGEEKEIASRVARLRKIIRDR